MRIPYQLNEMRMADPAFSHSLRSVDFSEYEWMEHIEEFDREVILIYMFQMSTIRLCFQIYMRV